MLPTFLSNLDPSLFLSDNYVVLDFETDTSHGDYGHPVHSDNQLLLGCYRLGPKHPFPGSRSADTQAAWGNELEQQELPKVIDKADFIVAHNAKYELGWLKRMGVDLRKVIAFDTKLAEYVLLGNLAVDNKKLGIKGRGTSLDECCRRRGLPVKDPVVDIMIANGINPVRIPRPWLEGRCRQDVETTERVFLSQRDALQHDGRLGVLYTRCLLTPVLADIEQEGLAVDQEELRKEYDKYSAQFREAQTKMDAITGGINVRSVVQMAKFLYEDMGFAELTDRRGNPKRNAPRKAFPLGTPLTDQKTLDKLKATTEKQREFLVIRKELGRAQAVLSKNLEFFRGVTEEYGGIFYGEIAQTNTATHRTASRGMAMSFATQPDDSGKPTVRKVQFQNFPRVLKHIIKAKREGWLIADPDGSQIEFRCAACLGDDPVAISDINDPTFDAHAQTASILHNCTVAEVLKEKKAAQKAGRDDWRQLAKPDTYKPLYGGKMGTPEQEAYYKWFRQHYAGISKTQDAWVEEVVETKQLRTPWGLVYYWPHASRSATGRVSGEAAINNYPIQALATAEIMPIATVYLWHRLREAGLEDKVKLINVVHDSIPCEVHPDAVEPFTALIKRCFTADVYNYLLKVYGFRWDTRIPLGVGLKVGTHWGSGSERSWDIYSDGKEVTRK